MWHLLNQKVVLNIRFIFGIWFFFLKTTRWSRRGDIKSCQVQTLKANIPKENKTEKVQTELKKQEILREKSNKNIDFFAPQKLALV